MEDERGCETEGGAQTVSALASPHTLKITLPKRSQIMI